MKAVVPAHVFLEVHMACNLRCGHCDIHRLHNPPDELTLEERRDVIRHLSEWDHSIRVVLTGGEPFLRRDMLYAVAREARASDLYVTLSTNGTLLTKKDIKDLPHSGIRCVVVSLDSHLPEVHDRLRGAPGTFAKAVRAIKDLVQSRDTAHTDFTVLTSTILGRHNLSQVPEMVGFFEGLGVDTTLFQPIQPTFARDSVTDWWKCHPLFPEGSDQIESGIQCLKELRATGRRLFQTPEQFDDIGLYFANPAQLPSGQCRSMNRHLMVDMVGNVRLCFNMDRVGLQPVGNVRQRSLRELWDDPEVESTRERMRHCREGCGSMLCHAR